MHIQKKFNKIIVYLALFLFIVVALFPIYWMINTSLKTDSEIYLRNPTFFPRNIILTSYKRLLFESSFIKNLLNSIILALSVTTFTIFFGMLASYAVARLKVRGAKFISKSMLYMYLLPRTLLFIPLYMLVVRYHLNNSRLGLAIVYPTFTLPYAMWMLIAYFKTIPKEIEESAMIDGCNTLKIMFSIFFPLAIPGILSTAIFCFTLCWNEYLYALIMISDSSLKTFPIMLSELMADDVYAWGPLMAGAAISCLPILVIYCFSSSKVTSGLLIGSVKE